MRTARVGREMRRRGDLAADRLSMAGVAFMVAGVAVLLADLVGLVRASADVGSPLTSLWDLLPSVLRPFAPDAYADLLQAFPLSLALIILGVGLYRPAWPRWRNPASGSDRENSTHSGRRLAA